VREIWASEPRHGRLFILYLVVVSCILIVRSLKLTWRLYSFSSRKRFSLANIRDGIDTPELLVQSGLTNRLCDTASAENEGPERTPPLGSEPVLLILGTRSRKQVRLSGRDAARRSDQQRTLLS
jgi:hypothetical protein